MRQSYCILFDFKKLQFVNVFVSLHQPPRPDLRNGVLRSYSISYREYDPNGKQFKRWQHLSVTATREVEIVTLINLKPSAFYGVLIQAKTNAGIGPASTAPLCSTLDDGKKENMKED